MQHADLAAAKTLLCLHQHMPDNLHGTNTFRDGCCLLPSVASPLWLACAALQTTYPCCNGAGAVESMQQGSAEAAGCLRRHGATGCTDVTGFGLLGHLAEMTRASQARTIMHCCSRFAGHALERAPCRQADVHQRLVKAACTLQQRPGMWGACRSRRRCAWTPCRRCQVRRRCWRKASPAPWRPPTPRPRRLPCATLQQPGSTPAGRCCWTRRQVSYPAQASLLACIDLGPCAAWRLAAGCCSHCALDIGGKAAAKLQFWCARWRAAGGCAGRSGSSMSQGAAVVRISFHSHHW